MTTSWCVETTRQLCAEIEAFRPSVSSSHRPWAPGGRRHNSRPDKAFLQNGANSACVWDIRRLQFWWKVVRLHRNAWQGLGDISRWQVDLSNVAPNSKPTLPLVNRRTRKFARLSKYLRRRVTCNHGKLHPRAETEGVQFHPESILTPAGKQLSAISAL